MNRTNHLTANCILSHEQPRMANRTNLHLVVNCARTRALLL
jgi:hypothetical protein